MAVLWKSGRSEEALSTIEKFFAFVSRKLGFKYPKTLKVKEKQINLLLKSKRNEEAIY